MDIPQQAKRIDVDSIDLPGDLPLDPRSSDALFVVSRSDEIVDVKIEATEALVHGVAKTYFEGDAPQPRTALRIDFAAKTISIFPQLIYFSERLYQQKYKQLEEIQIDFPSDLAFPVTHSDVVDILKGIPNGFIKDPAFGLGFVKEMRPLVNSIRTIKEVRRLVISENESTRVSGDTFFIGTDDYLALRNGMNRIARHHQMDSLIERDIMAHNGTIHAALPDKHRFKERPYRPGTVFKLLGGTQSAVVNLRGKDRLGVLNAVAANANAFASRDPKEFVQLQKDIEIVGLDSLIDAVTVHIARNSAEGAWQTLLELNPFLLSMLFGQPIVLLQSSASVGGQNFTGHGTKITDFLAKNAITHNAALVEIKRPSTALLARKEYRGGVFAPARDLMGSVAQVLDQRLKLLTNIAQTKFNSKGTDIEVAAVECVVVAGLTPKDAAALSSFELFRSSLKDVRIITFDELLERLQLLRELLAGDRYVSAIDDEPNEDEWFSAFNPFEDSDADNSESTGMWGANDSEDDDTPF